MRDVSRSQTDCVVKYFADEFHKGGNDRCVADMKEAQEGVITCFNVGKRPADLETVFESGGGPPWVC